MGKWEIQDNERALFPRVIGIGMIPKNDDKPESDFRQDNHIPSSVTEFRLKRTGDTEQPRLCYICVKEDEWRYHRAGVYMKKRCPWHWAILFQLAGLAFVLLVALQGLSHSWSSFYLRFMVGAAISVPVMLFGFLKNYFPKVPDLFESVHHKS